MLPINESAFLTMLAHSEGCDRVSDPYRCCYRYTHTIVDLNYHPAEDRPGGYEWKGETLPDEMCIDAGFSPGCRSTAAGRYQITKPSWLRLKAILHLTDFGPDAQDHAALKLIKERGALDHIDLGHLDIAIALCSPVWASLPGNRAKQPQKSLLELTVAYTDAGGVLA